MAGNTDIIINQKESTSLILSNGFDFRGISKAIDILNAEGGENFYNYVNWLGLAEDPDLVVLSSLRHYYYDAEEMKNVNTIINLKELNQIKQISSFFRSLLRFLPQRSNFIGCFTDNKRINRFELRGSSSSSHNKRCSDAKDNGIISGIPFLNMLYSLLDSKINTYMSESSVSFMLEDYGFTVRDMTRIDGLTFFHSQKVLAASDYAA